MLYTNRQVDLKRIKIGIKINYLLQIWYTILVLKVTLVFTNKIHIIRNQI